MFKNFRSIALLSVFALAACGGGSTPSPAPSTLPASNGLKQQSFVGIGDSLTFGEQAGGMMGALGTSTLSGLPNQVVPPTQTNGFFALMYAQMNGIALDPAKYNLDTAIGNGSTSPLPLINAPGLGSQLVVSASKPPFTATHSGCDQFNQIAYSASGWMQTRVSPNAPIADLGIPGLTMHEAVSMSGPITGPPSLPDCSYVTIPGDPTSGGLQSLVQGESQLFNPVLGQFEATLGPTGVTPLKAAISLKPQLTTVWLGANDVLKYIFSHGQSPVTDTPQQLATDLTTIVTSLQKAGSKVVVANLPDILGNPTTQENPVPQFFPQWKLSTDLQALGVPATAAAQIAGYVQATYTKGAGGYLTESGFFGLAGQIQRNPGALPNLDPQGPGSGEGKLYIDQTFAAQAIALNAAYNQAINGVAQSTGAALADIQTTFQQINAAGGVPLAPGVTVTLGFGGGILSYDGLHPSNIGYALIANTFIAAADTKYSLTIPPLSAAQIGGIAQSDTYNPYVIKAVNPNWPFPLP